MSDPTHKNFYERLEVHPHADEEEIREAYHRIRRVYGGDSMAAYGLYSPDELREYLDQVEEAFRTLADPERRQEYNRTLFSTAEHETVVKVSARRTPSPTTDVYESEEREEKREPKFIPVETDTVVEVPEPASKEIKPAPNPNALPPRPPAPDVEEDVVFSGAEIRRFRELAGVELRDVSEYTKISPGMLRMIEDEDFTHLPALVYVRGFVTEYAKYLRLDPNWVARDFLARYREHQDEKG